MIAVGLSLAIGPALSGCGAIGAISRGGTADAFADANASVGIKSRMSRASNYYLNNVDVEVTEGIALLSGDVPRPEDRIEAERLAWTAEHVHEVANEITVGAGRRNTLAQGARDEVTAQSVRAALLADGDVRSVNYNVEVHDGVVYLLGVARDGRELDRAATTAGRVNGVNRVVTYVRIEGQPMPEPAPAQ